MPDRTGLGHTRDLRAFTVCKRQQLLWKRKGRQQSELSSSRKGDSSYNILPCDSCPEPAAIAAVAAAAVAATASQIRTPIDASRTLDYREYDVRRVERRHTGATLLLPPRRLQQPPTVAESRSQTLPLPRTGRRESGVRQRAPPSTRASGCGADVINDDDDDYGFATVAAAAAAAAAAERTAKHRDASSVAARSGSEPVSSSGYGGATTGAGRHPLSGEAYPRAAGERTLTTLRSAPSYAVSAAGGLSATTGVGGYRSDSPGGVPPWTYDTALKAWISTAGLVVHLDGDASIVQLSAAECRSLRKLAVRRLQELGIGSAPPSANDANGGGCGGNGMLSVASTAADRVTGANTRQTLVRWLKKSCKQVGLAVASAAGGLRKKEDDAQSCFSAPAFSNSFGSTSSRLLISNPTAVENTVAAGAAAAVDFSGARRDLLPHCPRVPAVARAYMTYLESRCLSTVGLFRIGSTRRRIRELQTKFAESETSVGLLTPTTPAPSPAEVELNPHDVACLLKSYFRRLPDALLCCRLYHTFLSTRDITDLTVRIAALRYLVAVLPVTNRDLLYSLLKLLAAVASNARDRVDADGNEVAGNKMDSRNLAAMFGPCILRERSVGNELPGAADMSSVRGAKDAIEVVAEMIDNWSVLFTVTKDLHDEIIRDISKTDPVGASFLLYTKASMARQGTPRLPVRGAPVDAGNYVELAVDQLEQQQTARRQDGAPLHILADESLGARSETKGQPKESGGGAPQVQAADPRRAGSIDSALSSSDVPEERVSGDLAFYYTRSAAVRGGGSGSGDLSIAESSGAFDRTLRLARTKSSDADSGVAHSPREWSAAMSCSAFGDAETAATAAYFLCGGRGGNGQQQLSRSRSLNTDDRLLVLPEAVTYV